MIGRLWAAFDAPPDETPADLGGKAAGLHRLVGSGAPVPPGFSLSASAFEAWIREAGAGEDLDRLGGLVRRRDRAEAEASAAALAVRLAAAEVPREVARAVSEGLGDLSEGTVAVRSSGLLEDGTTHSLAGLYRSVLGVPREEVEAALVACWLSAFEERAIAYLCERGLGPERLGLGVVVQTMVEPEVSGVLFTLDPRRAREDQVLVECLEGRGEELVSGRRDPARLHLAWDGTVVEAEWNAAVAEDRRPALLRAYTEDLLPLAWKLHLEAGQPLDLEFAWRDGRMWVVQARPVTSVSLEPSAGEWSNADFNEGGVASGTCSPFMWSLYDLIWQSRLPEYFRRIGLADGAEQVRWGRTFFGVPYWNVGEVKRLLAAIPGFDERAFDADLGIHKRYPEGVAPTPLGLTNLAGALRVLWGMYREFGRQRAATAAMLERFPEVEASWGGDEARARDDAAFAEAYRELIATRYFEVEGTYFMTIFNSSNAKLEFKGAFDRLEARAPGAVSFLDLLTGIPRLKTVEAAQDLYRLCQELASDPEARERLGSGEVEGLVAALAEPEPAPGWRAAIAAFLRRHGHHSRRELDPRVPRWSEDPGFVIEKIRQSLADLDPGKAPEVIEARQRTRHEEARERCRRVFGWNLPAWWWFRYVMDQSRGYCWLREEARDRSTRMYRIVRLWTLEMGRRLAARGALATAEDVFLHPWERLVAAASGGIDPGTMKALGERQRQEMARFAAFRPPRELGSALLPEEPLPPGSEGSVLKGVGGAPGRTRARVRVIARIEESGRLVRGEVLVTEFTDPGWTPLLNLAAAVVTEVGGVLSHAAVLSREYGVPAVLAVRGATRLLADGELVEVDGDAGTVRRLEASGEGTG